jgi:hypothetical protein
MLTLIDGGKNALHGTFQFDAVGHKRRRKPSTNRSFALDERLSLPPCNGVWLRALAPMGCFRTNGSRNGAEGASAVSPAGDPIKRRLGLPLLSRMGQRLKRSH